MYRKLSHVRYQQSRTPQFELTRLVAVHAASNRHMYSYDPNLSKHIFIFFLSLPRSRKQNVQSSSSRASRAAAPSNFTSADPLHLIPPSGEVRAHGLSALASKMEEKEKKKSNILQASSTCLPNTPLEAMLNQLQALCFCWAAWPGKPP